MSAAEGSVRSTGSGGGGGGGGSVTSSNAKSPPERPKATRKSSIFGGLGFGGGTASSKEAGGGKSKLRYKEADVRAITDMGFTKDQAIWALVQNDQNVLHAINSLTR